ncbi:MAG TPA: hypothetical protein VIO62_15610 [Candidatus Dormibacteraeota bacterium]|jgi:photosystem II stability/assembly factor-like uncharacterized protein
MKRLSAAIAVFGLVLVLSACGSAGAATRPSLSSRSTAASTDSPSAEPSVSVWPSATVVPTTTSSPAPASSGSTNDPGYMPALASIQMVTARLGWAAGSHNIYATSDGSHWASQYQSTNDYAGVDFISTTTGWVVGLHELLGTVDGGHTWHQLGEAAAPIRSVHFINASQGWGISGGLDVQAFHGRLVPDSAGTLVTTNDGGHSWSNMNSPVDAQTVCFSDAGHGWLGTTAGTVYASSDGGRSWTRSVQMPGEQPGLPGRTLIECAAPSALWAMYAPGGAAAGSSPYVVYATANGVDWRAVMSGLIQTTPPTPQGSGSYPGSFSVIDPSDAVFVGDTAAADRAEVVVASNGGATLRRSTGVEATETFDAAFLTTSTGWVLTRSGSGNYMIEATFDGGAHWSPQLSVTEQSPG